MALRQSFDIRSMRKVKPREGVAMVVQFVDITGAPTADLHTTPVRTLIGL